MILSAAQPLYTLLPCTLFQHLFWLDGYPDVIYLIVPVVSTRPSPPAPEGWSREILIPVGLSSSPVGWIDTTRYLRASLVPLACTQCDYSSSCCYVLSLCSLAACPSPPAPEGWDKDINTLGTVITIITSGVTV